MSDIILGQIRHPNEINWLTDKPTSGWLAIVSNYKLQEMERELEDLRKEVAKLRFLATPEARMTNAITKAFERDPKEAFEKETYLIDPRRRKKEPSTGNYRAESTQLRFLGWNACWEYFKELK